MLQQSNCHLPLKKYVFLTQFEVISIKKHSVGINHSVSSRPYFRYKTILPVQICDKIHKTQHFLLVFTGISLKTSRLLKSNTKELFLISKKNSISSFSIIGVFLDSIVLISSG